MPGFAGFKGAVDRNAPVSPSPWGGEGGWWNQGSVNWADSANVWGYNQTAGRYRQPVTLPSWASDSFADPQTFYQHVQGLPESIRGDRLAQLQADYQAAQKNQGLLDRSLGVIGEQREGLTSRYEDWQQDPRMQEVLDQMMARTSPEFDAISDRERAAYDLSIAQNAARAGAVQRAAAAGRGVSGGGAASSEAAATRGMADAAGVQVQAQLDAANERARQMNLEMLSTALRSNRGIDLAYESALGELTRLETAVMSNYEYNPADFTGWSMLGDAMRRADDEMAFREETFQQMVEEARFSQEDLFNQLIAGIGTGIGLPGHLLSLAYGMRQMQQEAA